MCKTEFCEDSSNDQCNMQESNKRYDNELTQQLWYMYPTVHWHLLPGMSCTTTLSLASVAVSTISIVFVICKQQTFNHIRVA